MANQLYRVTHSSPEFKTLGEFINDYSSAAFEYADNIDGFLKIRDENGNTNKKSIFDAYPTQQEKDENAKKKPADYTLKVGTKLMVEAEKISRAALLTEGIEVVSNDITAFKAAALAKLESDAGYKVPERGTPIPGQVQAGLSKDVYPAITVWLWSKALSDPGDELMKGKIFNLTPYVTRLSTTVAKNAAGQFQLSLAPIVCILNNDKWELRPGGVQHYMAPEPDDNKDQFSLVHNQFVASSNLYMNESLKRSSFLFNNIVGSNDLVFIRFETLAMEQKDRNEDAYGDIINANQLPNRIYDMIGLVDKTMLHTNPENMDIGIDITGRDLSKLFIDDGCYFFPLEFTGGKLHISGQGSSDNPLMQRVTNENALFYLGLYFNNSVERIFKFVIQQLSNIKIVDDNLFQAYGERRNTRFLTESEKVAHNKKINDDITANEQTAKEKIRQLRKTRGIAFTNVAQEAIKAEEVYRKLKNFLIAIREKKVRKVVANQTEGWEKFAYQHDGAMEQIPENYFLHYVDENLFNVTEPTNVTTYGAAEIIKAIDNVIDQVAAQPKYEPEYVEKKASGIWQIVKLVIDENISNRRLIDSAISSASGNLMNFFSKACQEPFVEYQMDTYGDMFYIMVRKSPYDKQSIVGAIQERVRTENNTTGEQKKTSEVQTLSPAIISIEPEDVLSESLGFSDSEAISWYQLTPRGSLMGRDEFATAYLPAIYFPEYARVFGSKAMQYYHYYMPSAAFDPHSTKLMNTIEKQVIADLKFMIESTAYLPFTRSGTLVINRDRRIKVGNFIRHKSTGEIFYVEGVQHNYSISDTGIDAYTSIQVSRGMVEPFIYGVEMKLKEKTQTVSYFNIINTTVDTHYLDQEKLVPGSKTDGGADNGDNDQKDDDKQSKPLDISKVSDEKIISGRNRNLHELDGYAPKYKKKFIQFINILNDMGYNVGIVLQDLYDPKSQLSRFGEGPPVKKQAWKPNKGRIIKLYLQNQEDGTTITDHSSESDWVATGAPEVAALLGISWKGPAKYYNGKQGLESNRANFEATATKPAAPKKAASKKAANTTPVGTEKKKDKVVGQKMQGLEKAFSNFKVNEDVFNFFLHRRQMDPAYTPDAAPTPVSR